MPSDDLTLRMRTAGARTAAREIGQPTASVRKLRQELRATGRESGRTAGHFRVFSSGLRPMVSLATSAGVALGALGLAGAMKTSINAASDLNEEINKTNVVFRGSERGLLDWSKTAADTFGQSRTQALQAANTFGNLLVPLGFSRRAAAGMSQSMVELASDMASFNNADPSDTLDAIRAGLAGESEPLRRYGVFLNDARLRQEAMTKGIYDGTGVLTNHQRAVATYALLLKDTRDAQGDFARTSGGLANQQRTLRAQLADLSAELGTALLPLVNRGVAALVGFIKQFREWKGTGGDVRRVLAGLAAVLATVGAFLWSNRDAVVALTAATLAGYAAWKSYLLVKKVLTYAAAGIKLWKAWREGTLLVTAAQLGLNTALFANPIGLVVAAVAGLVAALTVAYFKVGWFRAGVDAAFGAIKTAVSKAVGFIKTVWPTVWSVLKWTPFIRATALMFGAVKAIFTRGWKGLLNYLIDKVNALIGIMNSAIHAYNRIPLAPNIPDIPTIGHLGDEGGSTAGTRVRTLRGRRDRHFFQSLMAPSPLLAGASTGGDVWVDATLRIDGETAARTVQRASKRRKAVR